MAKKGDLFRKQLLSSLGSDNIEAKDHKEKENSKENIISQTQIGSTDAKRTSFSKQKSSEAQSKPEVNKAIESEKQPSSNNSSDTNTDAKVLQQASLVEVENVLLDVLVKESLSVIDKKRKSEIHSELSFVKGSSIKFDDKYPIFTVPMRQEYHDLINALVKHSSLKKYQLCELLIFNGLKHTKFD